MRWIGLVVVLVALAGAGCQMMRGGATEFEVEAFQLDDAKVVDLEGASGGKAVLLTTANGEATTALDLSPGTYELVVYGYAPSYDEDALYVMIGDYPEQRLVLSDIQKIAATKPVTFKVEKAGPVKVRLAFGEENVQLDRIVVRPAK
ncbi:MAG: hypothetical protein R6V58_06190 [Planctomycetota bacterium]